MVLEGSVCCQRQIPAVRIKCSNWHFGDTCTMVYNCNVDRRRIQVIIKIMDVKYFPFLQIIFFLSRRSPEDSENHILK